VKYRVEILDTAIDFIKSLDNKMKAKVVRTIELLKDLGPSLPLPHSKKLKGYDLYELRTKFSTNIVRMFYFHSKGNLYIITSGYIKKDEKTDKNEIERAIRLKDHFRKEVEDEANEI
jgi:phage-related protein